MTFTAGLTLLATFAVFAQTSGGNVFGTVTDDSGAGVPGVTVTLSGIGASQVFVTDANGSYRFLNQAPGRYTVRAELNGFAPISRSVDVSIGANSAIDLALKPAVSAEITITDATPVIDTRSTNTGSEINEQEMREVPSARDPWVVLQTVPGVLVSTVNVGGNQSGQQSYFIGKGIERHQTEWNLDGVNVTEMQATGTSDFYYDFDSFQDMQITTGGSDPRLRTPGVQINMVSKRGSNDFNGSGRFFWTDKEFQSDAEIPSEAQSYLASANSINRINDYGLEAGGPILKDRLWLWGAYSKNDIDNFIAGPLIAQKTHITSWNGKLNFQPVAANNASAYFMFNNKTVHGRGLSITRPIETATDQSGPGHVLKFEDTHIFGGNFYVTGLVGIIENGYELEPIGGRDVNAWWTSGSYSRKHPEVSSGWHRSYNYFQQDVPQKDYRVDGSNFVTTGKASHELKWGFEYRDTPVSSETSWPGNQTFGNFYDGSALAALTRNAVPNFGSKYKDLYVGDTLILGDLTVNVGARYDWQSAKNFASSVPANPLVPDILPAVSYAGDDRSLEWNGFSPRVGATYSFGQNNRAVVRGSYAHYINQLGSSDVGSANPFYRVQYLYYYWDDTNGDRNVQRNEIDFASGVYSFANIDPNHTDVGYSPGRVDYGMKAPSTDELVGGFQYELTPGFAVSANYTHRRSKNFTWSRFEKTRGAGDYYTSADYVQAGTRTGKLPNGQTYSVPYYTIKPTVATPVYYVFTNRDDYSQTYQDVELSAVKRMQNHWMMRANVTLADWKQHVGADAIVDPTPLLSNSTNSFDSCSVCDGATVASGGGIGNNYINSRWAYSVTGVYQLPWQFSVGAALNGREGYLIPYRVSFRDKKEGTQKNLLVSSFDDSRLPNITNLDLRLAKDFAIRNDLALNFSIDVFNVLNTHTVLDRNTLLDVGADGTGPAYNHISTLMSPRVVRFGARARF
ncbi:MAG TPA: TonB-dependent receptor [Thermoanaerobaculia bacterium]|nr:TonB-dependent receptor [Thermoanaerobaculia bacterium]